MYKSVLENPLCLEGFELQHILEYAEIFSYSTGNNSVATRMKQGLELYNDKFLSDLRFVIPEDGKFTITAVVRAAMKKRVKYQPVSKLQTGFTSTMHMRCWGGSCILQARVHSFPCHIRCSTNCKITNMAPAKSSEDSSTAMPRSVLETFNI
ncbi:hypothetical protein AVEN_137807-1 [Araneus ventricosus]|uniref:Uncharacterized protein n=1 Tax=Araneus ventricosus TaxID=182803 RepID=A0A4Y2U099_ARAVE|nr:hypothetical protein AVEN_137807-1 [Araneus ventricosus]